MTDKTVTLVPGETYRFKHRRKGVFEATFLEMWTEPSEDGEGETFVCVEIDTSEWSPYAHLANSSLYIPADALTREAVEEYLARMRPRERSLAKTFAKVDGTFLLVEDEDEVELTDMRKTTPLRTRKHLRPELIEGIVIRNG